MASTRLNKQQLVKFILFLKKGPQNETLLVMLCHAADRASTQTGHGDCLHAAILNLAATDGLFFIVLKLQFLPE